MPKPKSRAARKGGNLINKNQRSQLEAIGYGLNLPPTTKPAKKKPAKRKKK